MLHTENGLKQMIFVLLRGPKSDICELAFGCFGFARYSEKENKLRWYHGLSSFVTKDLFDSNQGS
jgi:hypothetical protein